MILETARLLLPWRVSDADILYESAKDLRIGSMAGGPVHTSVENPRYIIREVLSAAQTCAVTMQVEDTAVGGIGQMIGGKSNLNIPESEGKIGCRIAVPYWRMQKSIPSVCNVPQRNERDK